MTTSVTTPTARPLPRWQLVCGVLALGLFAQKLVHDWPLGLAANNLWLCHLGNLALGVALLLRWPLLARVAVLWILAGLPIWLIDVAFTRSTTVASVLSHVGGAALAVVVLSGRGWAAQRRDWLVAWAGFLAAQQLARALTPPELNVNVAHAVHPSARAWFDAYPPYALFIAALAALVLWLLHAGLAILKR
jgi:hypothetical protein